MQRTYGGGEISQGVVIDANSHFTRTMINYPSDGLNIAGFMNVPNPQHMADLGISPPYPVVIALHGYIDPAIYNTVDYTTRYADDLARAGFIVLHPNLRGYRPSDDGDNLFRVGMATDVLNLVALVQETAGKPGALSQADPASIGLWGHSMGGGITTRVITVDPAVKAAVLYGAMSPDDQKNYDRIYRYFSSGTRGLEELQAPDEAFTRISPLGYLDQIQAAVAIHHGEQDADVPLAWSLDTCRRLQELEKQVACYTYPDQPHTFLGQGDALFTSRVIDFFNQTLR
jgi:dipeptidyl aminopeptidase/acylaminoacyl peptidase